MIRIAPAIECAESISDIGQSRPLAKGLMSAFPSEADILEEDAYLRFAPDSDMRSL
jgi:hypothetical protein